MIPDTSRLSELPRVCLQESEEIPPDYTRLFNTRLFSISTAAVPRGKLHSPNTTSALMP